MRAKYLIIQIPFNNHLLANKIPLNKYHLINHCLIQPQIPWINQFYIHNHLISNQLLINNSKFKCLNHFTNLNQVIEEITRDITIT